jgi:hypothetical protein
MLNAWISVWLDRIWLLSDGLIFGEHAVGRQVDGVVLEPFAYRRGHVKVGGSTGGLHAEKSCPAKKGCA